MGKAFQTAAKTHQLLHQLARGNHRKKKLPLTTIAIMAKSVADHKHQQAGSRR